MESRSISTGFTGLCLCPHDISIKKFDEWNEMETVKNTQITVNKKHLIFFSCFSLVDFKLADLNNLENLKPLKKLIIILGFCFHCFPNRWIFIITSEEKMPFGRRWCILENSLKWFIIIWYNSNEMRPIKIVTNHSFFSSEIFISKMMIIRVNSLNFRFRLQMNQTEMDDKMLGKSFIYFQV